VPTTGEGVESPEFICCGEKWKLILYPHGREPSVSRNIQVSLVRLLPSEIKMIGAVCIKTRVEGHFKRHEFNLPTSDNDDSSLEIQFAREDLAFCGGLLTKNWALALEVCMSPSNQHYHYCHAVEELKSSKRNMQKLFLRP
jgi:hypothetical protein